MTDTGPLVQLQMSFSRLPWRIAPGWAVMAGALAGRMNLTDTTYWLPLVAAIVLADAAWGLLRGYAASAGLAAPLRAPAILPYATPDGPLARFLGALAMPGESGRAGWQGALGGLALTAAVSILLGWQAGVLSLAAALLVWLAWAIRRRGDRPALCYALLDLGLPWLLGLWLAAGRIDGSLLPGVTAAAGLTALQWGLLRVAESDGRRRGAFWGGCSLLVVLLVVLRSPMALALGAILLAPAALAVARAPERALVLSGPWTWAALMTIAIGLA